MDLKTYIFSVRKITMAEAARELGTSRQRIFQMVKSDQPAGKRLAVKIQAWSRGVVTALEAMRM